MKRQERNTIHQQTTGKKKQHMIVLQPTQGDRVPEKRGGIQSKAARRLNQESLNLFSFLFLSFLQRQTDRKTERERETDRQTLTHRETRHRKRRRQRETEREKTERQRGRDRQTDRQKERQTDRQRASERQTDRDRDTERENRERERRKTKDRQTEQLQGYMYALGDLGAEATGTQHDTATNDWKEKATHDCLTTNTEGPPCQRKRGGIKLVKGCSPI